MPDPETDFPSESSLSADAQFNGAPKREPILDHADGDRLSGADDDDAETSYDPTGIEANRARELGLGVGERDLQRQKDPVVFDSAADDDQLEVGERLSEHRPDRTSQQGRPVVRVQHDRHLRRAGPAHSSGGPRPLALPVHHVPIVGRRANRPLGLRYRRITSDQTSSTWATWYVVMMTRLEPRNCRTKRDQPIVRSDR